MRNISLRVCLQTLLNRNCASARCIVGKIVYRVVGFL